ncbi:Gfo/Idh/MocA family protein [Christiangramia sabulilitoris]|uniref:Gfo/Idh/MocA family oxidoreductase n=1 Tax=Christiangramia sabulilitoris TaxID=2583991 RepID=A0A550I6C9_9FLAO|nr:Gfo/Idh/MocA family oxidoreductase [Christiangramia sabulilitoris]TRO66523.1 Gfo/Idh/MocA family oxidoreductase [Christiangramia sabulilitoris]
MKLKPITSSNSRRDFIKKSGLAATGFYIVPRHVLGGPGFIPPSDKLLIAGIGVGGKGESDLLSFYETGKAEIAYLCDVDDRLAAASVKRFSKAKYYKDYRELYDNEAKNFDAVCVSTPDHNHAVQAMGAMQRGKHVYVQKPLTHDIYEARKLTEAAKEYRVVTQMGNQGASGDGVRRMKEWYEAGVIGDVNEVYVWTNRPVWPQGISWPEKTSVIPAELDWDLWLGTAPYKDYVDGLVPFNWRGWWEYGTGALGDMGCHLVEPAFNVLELKYPHEVECSVGSIYVDEFQRGYFPESCPPSSHVIMRFAGKKKSSSDIKLHWMDGGIKPMRPDELGSEETFGDGGNGTLIIGTKGKMMCGTYGLNPRLLPTSRTNEVIVSEKYPRVKDGMNGHYAQWVEAAIAGYKEKTLSSPFEIAGPLTETLLIANLAIRGYDIQKTRTNSNGKTQIYYPGRDIKMIWDAENLKVTNFEEANQFVKRDYREGYSL